MPGLGWKGCRTKKEAEEARAARMQDSDTIDRDEDIRDTHRSEEARTLECDGCELLRINGVICHEHGCPNKNARWDADGRMWVKQRECGECGCTVDDDETCCDTDGAL